MAPSIALNTAIVIPDVRGTQIRNPATFNDTGCRIESGMTT
jgi:hypothetical protein